MYAEIHDWKKFEQKTLYFKLNNVLNLSVNDELNRKFCGIYAIYKNDICLYVGQSTNLASRIATHIKGKYEDATEIFLWNVENIGFPDFYERDKNWQKKILDNCEKYLMTKLKPIENLSIDMDFKLAEQKTPTMNLEDSSCFSIYIEKEWNDLYIKESDCRPMFLNDIIYEIESSLDFKDKLKNQNEAPDIINEIIGIIYSKDFDFQFKDTIIGGKK